MAGIESFSNVSPFAWNARNGTGGLLLSNGYYWG
jgi:hypothetical protein